MNQLRFDKCHGIEIGLDLLLQYIRVGSRTPCEGAFLTLFTLYCWDDCIILDARWQLTARAE